MSGQGQVWSLAPFCPVVFSQLRSGVKKCVFYKHISKVCAGVSGPLRLEDDMPGCFCASGVSVEVVDP